MSTRSTGKRASQCAAALLKCYMYSVVAYAAKTRVVLNEICKYNTTMEQVTEGGLRRLRVLLGNSSMT